MTQTAQQTASSTHAPTAPSRLEQEIESFLLDRRARALSPRTLDWYREKLASLSAYAARQGVDSLLGLTPHLVRAYLLEAAETHSPGGVHGLYRALRALVRWFGDEYEPPGWRDPLRRVRAPKVPEQILEPVSLNDLGKMLAVCNPATPMGLRDRALLLVLLDTGCRAQELVQLSVGDVSLENGCCQVRSGKGRKPRFVFVGTTARQALQAYLADRGHPGPLEPLFATQREGRLRYAGLREIVRRRARQADVPAPSLHSFRRAFALCCLRSGMDIFALQRLMGHADLSILRRYLAQTEEDLRRAHESHGPVDVMIGSQTGGVEAT